MVIMKTRDWHYHALEHVARQITGIGGVLNLALPKSVALKLGLSLYRYYEVGYENL